MARCSGMYRAGTDGGMEWSDAGGVEHERRDDRDMGSLNAN